MFESCFSTQDGPLKVAEAIDDHNSNANNNTENNSQIWSRQWTQKRI